MKIRNSIVLLIVLFGIAACGDRSSKTDQTDNSTKVKDEKVNIEEPVKEAKPVEQGPFVFKQPKNKHPQGYFSSPFDSSIRLAGSFCELRGNHFHGGLDIRTGGMEGWEVKSAAQGYVSRIKVSAYGYGNALYIQHPNGYTTVYGHLKSFNAEIAAYVEKAQYEKRSFEVDLYPGKALKVEKGEVVALSGNTGGSGGPHLHFEIRNSAGLAVNPLLFGLDVEDVIPPVIKQLMIYHKDRDVFLKEGGFPMKKLKKESEYFNGKPIVLRPGTYSFGLLSKDYFTDTRNKLGINYCWLLRDDQLMFKYEIESMNFDMGRQINIHIDPYQYFNKGVRYVRLFKESYNKLPYYKQDRNGEVYIKEGDTVHFKVVVMDLAGQRDSLQWVMIGSSQGEKLTWQSVYSADSTMLVKASKTNHLSYGKWKISIPASSIYHDFYLKFKDQIQRPGTLSPSLQIHYGYTPLHSHIQVSCELSKEQMAYGQKLCAVSYKDGNKVYEGGGISNGRLHFKTRSFGEYTLAVDSTPPRIKPETVSRNLRFRISDDLSGIKSYILSVDDKWVLLNYEPKLNLLFGKMPEWVKPGKHQLKLVVIDDRGNRKEYLKDIQL